MSPLTLLGIILGALVAWLVWQIRRDLHKRRCKGCDALFDKGWLLNGLCLSCRLAQQPTPPAAPPRLMLMCRDCGALVAVEEMACQRCASCFQVWAAYVAEQVRQQARVRSATPDADRLLDILRKEYGRK